ncbi:unnamed protein product [Rhizophagus irregularis]|uniref:Uncharacterized protein n=1 Tax=Rhizophagus irregularis TaxID=588596 RepID=A0A915ZP99_9GLOM|nr:unnamed protein product [Rhizophagus irregularis]CAB5381968.1 unnamed protein product [Rhizophagus irregularis]
METTKTKQLMTPSFVFEKNYIFPSITFQVTTRENSSNENYTSFWRSKSSGSFKGQTFQLREPEYRRLITSTCGKLIYRFNGQLSVITNLYHVKGTIYIYIPLYLTSNTTIITSNIERG